MNRHVVAVCTKMASSIVMMVGVALAIPNLATAAAFSKDLVALMDFTIGGDKLAEIEHWEGTGIILLPGKGEILRESGTQSIRAGRLIRLGGGVRLSKHGSPWEFQITLSCHFDKALSDHEATNSDGFKFDRWPLEFQIFRTLPKFRFGLGLTYHISLSLKFRFGGDDYREFLSFDDALGYLVEAGYDTGYGWVGLRYVHLSYNNPLGGSASGNHLGLNINWYL